MKAQKLVVCKETLQADMIKHKDSEFIKKYGRGTQSEEEQMEAGELLDAAVERRESEAIYNRGMMLYYLTAYVGGDENLQVAVELVQDAANMGYTQAKEQVEYWIQEGVLA